MLIPRKRNQLCRHGVEKGVILYKKDDLIKEVLFFSTQLIPERVGTCSKKSQFTTTIFDYCNETRTKTQTTPCSTFFHPKKVTIIETASLRNLRKLRPPVTVDPS